MRSAVHLDHNADTPPFAAVVAAMAEALAEGGNPSSVHALGRRARRRVEDARARVAGLVNGAEVVFTSGGTEANALALTGCGRARILVSAIEHPSVLAVSPDAVPVPALPSGVVDLDALAHLLDADGRPALVSLMLANNETGAIQPVAEAAALAHAKGALLHCDAVQAAGKIAVDMRCLNIDLLSLSAHKLGGPQGIGALVLADERLAPTPMLRGGGQERGLRAGSENVAAIEGFGVAAGLAADGLADFARLAALRDGLERRARGAVAMATQAPRLPNTSCLALPGLSGEVMVMAMDLAGVAVSAGAACSSGKVRASHVLAAMGAGHLAGSAIRVSLGRDSGEADVERFLQVWAGLAAQALPAASAA
ncbi:MAG: cysteine desulfurase [Alphaproteobacteria bacterium]|nr:cysteine desulfurase [Alphaproteobacteria bacterium]